MLVEAHARTNIHTEVKASMLAEACSWGYLLIVGAYKEARARVFIINVGAFTEACPRTFPWKMW